MTEDFVAHLVRWKLALPALIGTGFVLTGLWMVGAFGKPVPVNGRPVEDNTLLGWFCLIFFGGLTLMIIRRLFMTGEHLRIGPAGVRWAAWSDQTIPWSEITFITTKRHNFSRFLVLRLRDRRRYPGRGMHGFFSGLNHLFAGGSITIPFTGMDRSLNDAVIAVARFQPPAHVSLDPRLAREVSRHLQRR